MTACNSKRAQLPMSGIVTVVEVCYTFRVSSGRRHVCKLILALISGSLVAYYLSRTHCWCVILPMPRLSSPNSHYPNQPGHHRFISHLTRFSLQQRYKQSNLLDAWSFI